MIEIQPPRSYAGLQGTKIFLAGSIEMGNAVEWQKRVVEALAGTDSVVLNPRRHDWDSSWKQTIDHPQFREQVEWELQGLDDAELIVFYFDPATKAPVTLMELGLHAGRHPEKLIVCCPEGFWRKGNVDIVCRRYGVHQVETLEAMLDCLRHRRAA
jgi:hypothetical protein